MGLTPSQTRGGEPAIIGGKSHREAESESDEGVRCDLVEKSVMTVGTNRVSKIVHFRNRRVRISFCRKTIMTIAETVAVPPRRGRVL